MKPTLIILSLLISAGTYVQASNTRLEPGTQFDVVSVTTGKASWYGGRWIGRLTANGETYREGDMTAAHKTLPFGTMVRVTDERTLESAIVRINNRGPFIKGRAIDLSEAAAEKLGIVRRGVARVKLEVLSTRKVAVVEPTPTRKKNWVFALFSRNREAN